MKAMSIHETIGGLLSDGGKRDAMQFSPLVLAYMGDCVYDLFVRTLLVQKYDFTPHNLHMKAASLVNAAAQAEAARTLLETFTEQEAAVFRRGRNAHIGTVAKNASIADYRAATGLEAVIGYLYIGGEDERLLELMELALNTKDKDNETNGRQP